MSCLVASNVYDLLALAIGATRDGAGQARQRGVCAACLAVIRGDLLQQPDLTIREVALRRGVSPRYLQMGSRKRGRRLPISSWNADFRRRSGCWPVHGMLIGRSLRSRWKPILAICPISTVGSS